ncbi:MAG: hypothetical protein H7145_17540, partial [Akkermansiaceae bacterium]|nr:hypothetical protein [Armatimonadota bacterium]
MEIRPIRTEADYKAGLAEVERIFDAEPGAPKFERLEVLITLIEAYEAKVAPIGPPDPISPIDFERDRLVFTPHDTEDRTAEVITERRRAGRKLSRLYLYLWQECPSARGGYTARIREADLASGFDKDSLKFMCDSANHVFTTLIFIDTSGEIRLLHG